MANYKDEIYSIPLNTQVKMRLSNFNNSEEYNFMILQSSNISTVYIETESKTMDYVNADKDNKEDASILIIDTNGEITFEGMASITGRGNSSWTSAKKPYNLKFDNEVTLCGNNSAKTWYLITNYADESQIRNDLCLYIANLMDIAYTSDPEFISLFINGEYYGLYNIGTKDEYMADVDSQIAAVFEISSQAGEYDWISDNGTYIRFRDGDENIICDTINQFEDALFEGADYESIENYIDIDSFARKYCFEELVANHDIFKGQYFAISNNGIISAICAWDFDLSLGISYNELYDFSYNEMTLSNVWYSRLMKYDAFKSDVITILEQYSESIINDISQYMEECYSAISNDYYLNSVRWQNSRPYGSGRTILKTTSIDLSSLKNNMIYIINFIEYRIDFLKMYWSDPDAFCRIRFIDDTDVIVDTSVYCEEGIVISSEILPDGILSIDVPGFLGWYTEDCISITNYGVITENVTFYAAWESDDESLQEAA